MANPVPSACCVVLAAVVVVYAQRHSQQDSHTQYERVGADVTMKCGSMDWDAAVTWTANGTDIDESHLNGSYLILKNVDLSQSGQYSCYEGSSWHLKYQTTLRVGTPPKEPVLMCRSNNYPKGFYCSWHLPTPTYIPNSFNISVIHGTKDMVCEKDAVPKNRCHIRYIQLFSTVKYKVTLTVTNALGKNFTTLTFDEFAIVKPDPPESVVAKPVPNNPRRLEVSWQNPSSWPDPDSFPLKFFLRYRPLILDQWQHAPSVNSQQQQQQRVRRSPCAHICALAPTRGRAARHRPQHPRGASGRSCTQSAPFPWHFLELDPPFSQLLEGDHVR
ncbi:ciliary neurotrophic factor receptor subunit alpha isoform X2 [Passer montanus]|uniref:ciliary neurotrophic factor receptor subunit alpha isoform X2 n=1 Tax=Passer montanus TaxID=9160 RepID=UPI001960CD3D|nr:ciliary neurotrophic factor receptor subunit alpha isoform X2 [Passer montanus]